MSGPNRRAGFKYKVQSRKLKAKSRCRGEVTKKRKKESGYQKEDQKKKGGERNEEYPHNE